MHREHVAEGDAENPHGKQGDQHRVAHVVRGAQRVRQGKGQRPDEDAADAVHDEHLHRERGGESA